MWIPHNYFSTTRTIYVLHPLVDDFACLLGPPFQESLAEFLKESDLTQLFKGLKPKDTVAMAKIFVEDCSIESMAELKTVLAEDPDFEIISMTGFSGLSPHGKAIIKGGIRQVKED